MRLSAASSSAWAANTAGADAGSSAVGAGATDALANNDGPMLVNGSLAPTRLESWANDSTAVARASSKSARAPAAAAFA